MERTFVMLKPDCVQRHLVGRVIACFEEKGYKIVGLKMLRLSREKAEEHYAEHRGKPFYEALVEYITSGPVVAMVLEGKGVITAVRQMIGSTDPLEAAPGTIRGRFGVDVGRNVVHGSDGPASAAREVALFFRPDELISYRRQDERWVYEDA
ncbi:MAG: nucleoside-diphosphate kinase [Firmicutes bacterium]|nr:nucleoside-diphosphate kinase [Bacillota bacterium]